MHLSLRLSDVLRHKLPPYYIEIRRLWDCSPMPLYIPTQHRKTSFLIYKYLRACCAPGHYGGQVALRTSAPLLHYPIDHFLRTAAPVEKERPYSLDRSRPPSLALQQPRSTWFGYCMPCPDCSVLPP